MEGWTNAWTSEKVNEESGESYRRQVSEWKMLFMGNSTRWRLKQKQKFRFQHTQSESWSAAHRKSSQFSVTRFIGGETKVSPTFLRILSFSHSFLK